MKKKFLFAYIPLTLCLVGGLVVYSTLFKHVSKITYKTEGPGLKITGNKEQYGLQDSSATEIEVEVSSGYVFNSWSDGSTDLKRKDTFKTDNCLYVAKADYIYHDVINIEITEKTGQVAFDLETYKYSSFCKPSTFYNNKDLLKFDYSINVCEPVTINNDVFQNFTLYSMNTDKTMLRNLIAYSLVDKLFDFNLPYSLFNVYLNSEYQGLYFGVENITQDVDLMIGENSTAVGNYFTYGFRNDYVFYNKKNKKKNQIIKLIEKSLNNDKVDIESFEKCYALNNVLKNSSIYENDFYYYLTSDGVIHCSPYTNYSSSLGLWEWSDYSSSGDFTESQWFIRMRHKLNKKNIEKYEDSLFAVLKSEFSKAKSIINSSVTDSFDFNNNKWGTSAAFGNPTPTHSYSLEQFFNYLENYINERADWFTNGKQ